MAALTFTFTLLLAVAMATLKVKGNRVTDFLKLRAHSEHRYFYDVITEANMADLKASLSNFTMDHCYKVVAERRYLFIFRSNDTEALQALTFPSGSRVTQYPVETGEQYFEMFGLSPNDTGTWDFPENSNASKVLFFADWTLRHSSTLCPQAWEMEIVTWARQFKDVVAQARTEWFPIIATYPPRFLSFWAVEEHALESAIKDAAPDFGSYAADDLKMKRVIRL